MVIGMLNMLGYMLFSSLEYLGVFLLIFCTFSMRPEKNKLTIAILTLMTTFVSYILVITNLYEIIPIPVVLVPIVAYILKRIFNDKYVYSIITCAGSMIVYGLIQVTVIQLFVQSDFITFADTSNPYGTKTYTIQSICALIAISVSIYTRITYTGFGFSFYKLTNKSFVITTVLFLLICSMSYCATLHNESAQSFMYALILMAVGTVVVMYLSKRQDQREFI